MDIIADHKHAAVVAAIADHDPERAAAAMESHINGLRIGFDDIRHMNPDYFYEDLGNALSLLA
jgi:DNA-binding GntR family transcriptional regulator